MKRFNIKGIGKKSKFKVGMVFLVLPGCSWAKPGYYMVKKIVQEKSIVYNLIYVDGEIFVGGGGVDNTWFYEEPDDINKYFFIV
jgi:hypothetical protein